MTSTFIFQSHKCSWEISHNIMVYLLKLYQITIVGTYYWIRKFCCSQLCSMSPHALKVSCLFQYLYSCTTFNKKSLLSWVSYLNWLSFMSHITLQEYTCYCLALTIFLRLWEAKTCSLQLDFTLISGHYSYTRLTSFVDILPRFKTFSLYSIKKSVHLSGSLLRCY